MYIKGNVNEKITTKAIICLKVINLFCVMYSPQRPQTILPSEFFSKN